LQKVSGIDEAGRGSVFGSLFIVGVTLDQKSTDQLVKNGLKDSKLFSGSQGQKKRADLALKIQELAVELIVKEIPANEIDQTLYDRPHDNLNYLEIRNIGKIIIDLSSKEIIIDTISKPQYFVKHLVGYLNGLGKSLNINIDLMESKTGSFRIKQTNNNIKRIRVSEKADRIFPIVSAASCVAKYMRDKHLREIEEQWGLPPKILGKGYPHKKDNNVMKFLQSYQEDIKNYRFPFIRYSWSWPPLQQILKPHSKTLEKFFD
jgi:ribonuclease H